jgi:antitoxin VapB
MPVQIAKVFQTGRSQAVRLPREFRFDTDEVYIRKDGDAVILTPKPSSWQGFLEDCEPLPDDFSVEGAPLPEDVERTPL